MTPTFILLFSYCIFLFCLQIFRRDIWRFQTSLCYVYIYIHHYAKDGNKPFFIVLMEIVHNYYSRFAGGRKQSTGRGQHQFMA